MGHSITRRIEFDAGHRVYGHESKCSNIHGHRYVVEVVCKPNWDLDKIGRVVDFGVIKELVGEWIDDKLDHGMLLFKDDPLVETWSNGFIDRGSQEEHKYFIMDENPTAENIAKLIYTVAKQLLSEYAVKVTQVKVYETPNCFAVYSE